MVDISRETAWEMFKKLLLIRRVEEKIIYLFTQRQIRCPIHLSIGEEAIAVGICQALSAEDMVFSNHRCHAHYLAKGGSLKRMFAELYGRQTGCCQGMGGSMHLVDQSVNMMGSSSIVASSVPLAVGCAWRMKLKKRPVVTVSFFGDGAMEEGVLYESMNFAALHKLPIIFVCEDNGLATYTPLSQRQPKAAISQRASAFMTCQSIKKGHDCGKIYQMIKTVIANNIFPAFLHIQTLRFTEHVGPKYETEAGVIDKELMKKAVEHYCPIKFWSKFLERHGMFRSSLETKNILADIDRSISEAITFAQLSPFPSHNILKNITWRLDNE